MAVKNFWSFHPGETIVAGELQKHLKNYSLYFPLKDDGIDILAVDENKNVIKFQVKESKYHDKDHSWHEESVKNFEKNKDRCDYYIFVTYVPNYRPSGRQRPSFDREFIIVPMKELWGRVRKKTPVETTKTSKYVFYFTFDGNKTMEVREKGKLWEHDKDFDYTRFRNNWKLIK